MDQKQKCELADLLRKRCDWQDATDEEILSATKDTMTRAFAELDLAGIAFVDALADSVGGNRMVAVGGVILLILSIGILLGNIAEWLL